MDEHSLPVITADQMRLVDKLMVETYGIELEQMMEMAGRNLADLAGDILAQKKQVNSPQIVVACGTGHNGGGGLVAARYLSNRGGIVTVVLAGREAKLKKVPARHWNTLKNLPVNLIAANSSDFLGVFYDADLIIDAVIGYGLKGEPLGIPAHVIREMINSQNPYILSLDVPSGLNSTDGSYGELCVRAKATMTLALPKTGLLEAGADIFVGELYLADIGVPPDLYKLIGLQPQLLFNDKSILYLNSQDSPKRIGISQKIGY